MFLYGKSAANAIAVMSYLAADPGHRAGSAEIATARGIPKPLTAKLLTQLAAAGLVSGQPGPNGGYTLARPAEKIRLIDIASIFGPASSPELCPFGHNWCGKKDPCPLHNQIMELQSAARHFLEETHLAVFSVQTANCATCR